MPMNRADYPDDWEQISKRIRERDGQRCRHCGVKNHAYGVRGKNDTWYDAASDEEHIAEERGEIDPDAKYITIILTVTHLDHDTSNNDDDNLASLCQMCHNRYDAPHRQRNAAKTRQRKKLAAARSAGQVMMFESEDTI